MDRLYTDFSEHQYASTIGLSASLSALYPTIRAAYVEGLLGTICPYRDPEIRIRSPAGLVRMFKVHADDAENWRQRFFAEVGECFGIERFRLHAGEGDIVITKDTPIDDLVGRDRQIFFIDTEGSADEQVSAVSSPREQTVVDQEVPNAELQIADRLTDGGNDNDGHNDEVYNTKVREFLVDLTVLLITDQEDHKRFKASRKDGLEMVGDAFESLPLSDGKTMQDAVRTRGNLNTGHFIYRAYQVLQRMVSKATLLLNDDDNNDHGEKFEEYARLIANTAANDYVHAIQLFTVDAKVSHTYEAPLVFDGEVAELPERSGEFIAFSLKKKVGDGLAKLAHKTDHAVYKAKTHLKTATSEFKNLLRGSKYVEFSVVDGGAIQASKRAAVEPGQRIEILVLASHRLGPKEVMLRIEERASPDGKNRFCATYLLKRWKDDPYSISFTIPLRKGKYNIIVYEQHKGGVKNVWKPEGGASFNCASVGVKRGFKITWNQVAQLKTASPEIQKLIFLTPEITFGRVAGRWPYTTINDGKVVTTYSDQADMVDEINEWKLQRANQKDQGVAHDFYSGITQAAVNKSERILRCLYCMNIYLRNSNATKIDPGKYNSPGIDADVASLDDYAGMPDAISSTITLFGTTYDSSQIASLPFSSVQAVPVETAVLRGESVYESVDKEKLTNVMADADAYSQTAKSFVDAGEEVTKIQSPSLTESSLTSTVQTSSTLDISKLLKPILDEGGMIFYPVYFVNTEKVVRCLYVRGRLFYETLHNALKASFIYRSADETLADVADCRLFAFDATMQINPKQPKVLVEEHGVFLKDEELRPNFYFVQTNLSKVPTRDDLEKAYANVLSKTKYPKTRQFKGEIDDRRTDFTYETENKLHLAQQICSAYSLYPPFRRESKGDSPLRIGPDVDHDLVNNEGGSVFFHFPIEYQAANSPPIYSIITIDGTGSVMRPDNGNYNTYVQVAGDNVVIADKLRIPYNFKLSAIALDIDLMGNVKSSYRREEVDVENKNGHYSFDVPKNVVMFVATANDVAGIEMTDFHKRCVDLARYFHFRVKIEVFDYAFMAEHHLYEFIQDVVETTPLLRDITNSAGNTADEYLRNVKLNFEHLLPWAADAKTISLPPTLNYDAILNIGTPTYNAISKLLEKHPSGVIPIADINALLKTPQFHPGIADAIRRKMLVNLDPSQVPTPDLPPQNQGQASSSSSSSFFSSTNPLVVSIVEALGSVDTKTTKEEKILDLSARMYDIIGELLRLDEISNNADNDDIMQSVSQMIQKATNTLDSSVPAPLVGTTTHRVGNIVYAATKLATNVANIQMIMHDALSLLTVAANYIPIEAQSIASMHMLSAAIMVVESIVKAMLGRITSTDKTKNMQLGEMTAMAETAERITALIPEKSTSPDVALRRREIEITNSLVQVLVNLRKYTLAAPNDKKHAKQIVDELMEQAKSDARRSRDGSLEGLTNEVGTLVNVTFGRIMARISTRRHKKHAHILASIQAPNSRIEDNDGTPFKETDKSNQVDDLIASLFFTNARRDGTYVLVAPNDDAILKQRSKLASRTTENRYVDAVTETMVFNVVVRDKTYKLQITKVDVFTDVSRGRIYDASGRTIVVDDVEIKIHSHNRKIVLVVYTSAFE